MSTIEDAMVYLIEVSTGVELADEGGAVYFVIRNPSNAPFIGELDIPFGLPEPLRPYASISLPSTNLLEANDELRALIRPLGTVHPTVFEYSLDTSVRKHLYIRDSDPSGHQFVSIGCYCYNLCPEDVRSEAFREALALSGMVMQLPDWRGVELDAELHPSLADPSQLLYTYAGLLGLFQ